MNALPPSEPDLPEARLESALRVRASLVWAVPVLAALIAGGIAVRAFLARGPEVTIVFQSAEGLEAGKTRIRYRSVDVGTVRRIELTPDHRSVRVRADLERGGESLLARDSRFWIVRPRIAAGGVSGLGTLLSGSYIGMDIGSAAERAGEFRGLEVPPVVAGDLPGRAFQLHGVTLGSVIVGSPVYFRHLRVGQVTRAEVDADGRGVTIDVFVESPYDRYVTADARFWHASGFDVALSAEGLRIETESLAAILVGGVAFESPSESEQSAAAPAGASFRIAATRTAAMKSPNEEAHTYVLYFTESLRGLAVGAPVDFNGIDIGEVRSLGIEYRRAHDEFRFPVEIAVYPARIRARYRAGAEQPTADPGGDNALVARMIAHGFRGQLRSASLLTGQQYVALDFFPHAAPRAANPAQRPLEIPTVPGGIGELQAALTSIARKIDALPLEHIGAHLDQTLVELEKTVAGAGRLARAIEQDVAPELTGTLRELTQTLGTTRQLLEADGPLQTDLDRSLREIARSAESLRHLTEYLERHPEALLRGKPADPP